MSDQSDFAAQHIRELGTGFELAFLCDLDRAHHFNRIFGEEIRPFDIKLPVVNYESIDVFGRGFRARQESKK